MTIPVIIIFCSLLLIAYIFDLTSSKTKIPSVILLLLLGWLVRQATVILHLQLPDFSKFLPLLGTLGLILIVLEGSLELELNKSKITVIKKSIFGALIPILTIAFILSFLFQYYTECSLKTSLLNAIPFCVISSAIAIPSVRNLSSYKREFIIYESSFSDIIGVIFFNFIALNSTFGLDSFGHFGLQFLLIIVVSFVASIALSLLLSKIDHHIKFVPIILLIILIFTISEIYHLPALIFIMVFGLFIGNLDEFGRFKWINKFHPETLNEEVKKFKELTAEGAFLLRSIFFLLFGYLIETEEIINPDTFLWALGIVGIIFSIRTIQLSLSKLPLFPLLFVSPRGLITILLFLTISFENNISLVNKSLIIQVILLTALIMMFGLMFSSRRRRYKSNK